MSSGYETAMNSAAHPSLFAEGAGEVIEGERNGLCAHKSPNCSISESELRLPGRLATTAACLCLEAASGQ